MNRYFSYEKLQIVTFSCSKKVQIAPYPVKTLTIVYFSSQKVTNQYFLFRKVSDHYLFPDKK